MPAARACARLLLLLLQASLCCCSRAEFAPFVRAGCFFGLYEYFRRALEASLVGELANDLASETWSEIGGPALLDGAEELLDGAGPALLDGAEAVQSLLGELISGERLAELVDYALTLC